MGLNLEEKFRYLQNLQVEPICGGYYKTWTNIRFGDFPALVNIIDISGWG